MDYSRKLFIRSPDPRLKVARRAGAVVLELSPKPWIWREWLRVDDAGLTRGVDLLLPWGGSSSAERQVAWADVNQIIIQPRHQGVRRLDPNRRPGEFALIQERALCIFHSRGTYLEAGSDFDLGLESLLWMQAELISWACRRGRRVVREP